MPHPKDAPNAFRPGTADDRAAIAANSKNKEAAWKFLKWWGTEGYINMAPFGRTPLWRGISSDDTMKAFLTGFEDYDKHMDVERYKTVMFGGADKDFPIQFRTTAAAEIGQIAKEELNTMVLGDQKPEDALKNLKTRADEALGKVCKK
jgi:multiple sugar transport system substrate-binding protein